MRLDRTQRRKGVRRVQERIGISARIVEQVKRQLPAILGAYDLEQFLEALANQLRLEAESIVEELLFLRITRDG